MKKIALYFCVLLMNIFVLSGCTGINSDEKNIKSVVNNYLACIQSGDLEKANEYLDSDFNYMDVTFLKSIDTVKKYLSLTTAQITSVEYNDDIAAVCISFTHPDVKDLLFAQSSAIKLYSTDKDLDNAAVAFLEDSDCPIETNDVYLSLKKKQNNWEVVTDENFINAIVYAANSELSIDIITENEKKHKEIEDYIDSKITLLDFLVDFDSAKNLPIIKSVSVKNSGDKDITELNIGIDFISNSGAIIEQKKVKVLGVMDNPIKSGYLWKMDGDKIFEIKNLIQQVNTQKVNVYIDSVKLKDSEINTTTCSTENQYINEYLELTDYKVSMCKSYLGSEPGLSSLEVKNHGSKDIRNLTVTVYFQDNNNKNIAENSFMVIGSLFGGDSLKGNYSWKMENNKFFPIKNLADEVDISKYTVEITKIVFE